MTATPLPRHPEAPVIRLQCQGNRLLGALTPAQRGALEAQWTVHDAAKGEVLMHQGTREMTQFFVLDGILKRVVSNPQGKEMILRFAASDDMETSYAAWRLGRPTPYGIACVTRARVLALPLADWAAFVAADAALRERFERDVMQAMSDVMAHTITLHLLDATGRVHRFARKRPDLIDRLPRKELASHLNLSAETLSRLRRKGSI